MMKTNQRLWPYILLVNIAVYVTLMFCLNLTQRDTTSGKRSTWGHAWATENWTLFRESLAVSVDSQVKVGIGFAGLDRHVEEISAKLKDMDSHVRWLHDGVQWNIRSAGSRAENQSATASGSRFGNNSGKEGQFESLLWGLRDHGVCSTQNSGRTQFGPFLVGVC